MTNIITRGVKCLLIAAVLMMSSCIKENIDDCFAGLKLKFIFTLHTNDGGNRFGPDIQVVRVYFFDENGVLAHIQQEQGQALTNDYAMDVRIAPGKYTIIAWGGSNGDFYNSFHEGTMVNAATSDYENGVAIGKTTLTDFRIFLNYGIADDYPEDIIPTIEEFDDLYYGAAGTRESGTSNYKFEQIEVKAQQNNEKLIELIRNTNSLKVTITGISYLRYDAPQETRTGSSGANVLQVWVSGRNGRYKFDNSIGEYARLLRYHPVYRSLDQSTMVVDVKTVRLDMARHTAEPMYLTVQDPVTGITYPQQPIDVVNTLLQARDTQTGEYIYRTQEDFDKIYEHPIEIEIAADLSVKILINGWEIIPAKPEI